MASAPSNYSLAEAASPSSLFSPPLCLPLTKRRPQPLANVHERPGLLLLQNVVANVPTTLEILFMFSIPFPRDGLQASFKHRHVITVTTFSLRMDPLRYVMRNSSAYERAPAFLHQNPVLASFLLHLTPLLICLLHLSIRIQRILLPFFDVPPALQHRLLTSISLLHHVRILPLLPPLVLLLLRARVRARLQHNGPPSIPSFCRQRRHRGQSGV